MPIKKDDKGKRWVEMELVVPGTPEQVWQAIATGPGTTAWFTKTTIDERAGGVIAFDLGEYGSSEGEVTTWEPPVRFGYVEREWAEGAPPVATEITIIARSGGQCVVRMVHSLFSTSDDWDDQIEGFEGGWPAFFEVLRLYLAHFAGQKAAPFGVMASTKGGQLEVWRRLLAGLELEAANVGEERATPARPQRLAGIVECMRQDHRQRYVIMRLNDPGPGVVIVATHTMGESVNASISTYFYGEDAERLAAQSKPVWQSWLDAVLDKDG